jgi:hypothetical protein
MGFAHHGQAPPPPPEVALKLPQLSDRAVADTVSLAEAYGELRGALLGFSGISLMQSLGLGTPSSLSGVVVTARDQLDRARQALATPSVSSHDGIRSRAAALMAGISILDEQAGALARDAHAEVDPASLHAVRGLLARTAVPDAGLRHFTSVSCAGYPAAQQGHHGHDGHVGGHLHDHGSHRHG